MSRHVFDVLDTTFEIDYASWCLLEQGDMGKAPSLSQEMLIDLALQHDRPSEVNGFVERQHLSRTPLIREKEYRDEIVKDICPRQILWSLEPRLGTGAQVTHLWSDSTQRHREVEMMEDNAWRPQVSIISKLDADGIRTNQPHRRYLHEAHWASVYLDDGSEYRYLHARTKIQQKPPFSDSWSTQISSHEYLLVPKMKEMIVFVPRFSQPLQVLPNGQILNVFQTSNTSTGHSVRFPRFDGERTLYRPRSRSPRRNRDP
jgi:hypothetical protein